MFTEAMRWLWEIIWEFIREPLVFLPSWTTSTVSPLRFATRQAQVAAKGIHLEITEKPPFLINNLRDSPDKKHENSLNTLRITRS